MSPWLIPPYYEWGMLMLKPLMAYSSCVVRTTSAAHRQAG